MDSHVQDSREGIKKERSIREAAQEDYAQEIGEEICRLYACFEKERQSRIEQGERVVGNLDLQFGQVRDALKAEQKMRSETETTILRMLENMCLKMQEEMNTERRER